VNEGLKDVPLLNHVVGHGAVRWWAARKGGYVLNPYEFQPACDESFSLEKIKSTENLLDMSEEQFLESSAQLATLHFSAAKNLMHRLEQSSKVTEMPSTYTFVTGDGGGKPNDDRTSMGEINSHHVWGLSTALRREMKQSNDIYVREVRVGLPVDEEDNRKSQQPLSEDIGDLIAGLASTNGQRQLDDNGRLIKLETFDDLQAMMNEYCADIDTQVGSLPHYLCG